MSNELRVGIMFLVGLLLLVVLIATLTRWGQQRNAYAFTITFPDAQGIEAGADVRVSGVKVGQISSVVLDSRKNVGEVSVRVDRRVRLYKGYSYSIGIGGLVGERYIEILPTNKDGGLIEPGEVVKGTEQADFNVLTNNANTLVNNANKMIVQLSKTTESLCATLDNKQTQQNIKSAVANMQRTSASAADLAATLDQMTKRNQAAINYIVHDLRDVSADLRTVSDQLTPQLAHSHIIHNLDEATQHTAELTARLDQLTASVNDLINDKTVGADLHEAIGHLRNASADLDTMMAAAKNAAAPLPQVTANLQRASADLPAITHPFKEISPETAANLLAISRNLRQTSESIGGVAKRVAKVGAAVSAINFAPEARIMALTSGNDGHIRTDLNVDLHTQANLFRLGIADIGANSEVNAQFGNKLDPNMWFRYGIVQSEFGFGLDYQPEDKIRLSGELFDPNNVRMNALLDYRFNRLGTGWWLTGGAYDVFDHPRYGVGVTYRP